MERGWVYRTSPGVYAISTLGRAASLARAMGVESGLSAVRGNAWREALILGALWLSGQDAARAGGLTRRPMGEVLRLRRVAACAPGAPLVEALHRVVARDTTWRAT